MSLFALAICVYILVFEQCLLVKANPDFTEATIVSQKLCPEFTNSAKRWILKFKFKGTEKVSNILYCNKYKDSTPFYINVNSASQPIDTTQLEPKLVEEMTKKVIKSKNPEHTWNAEPIKLETSDVQESDHQKSSPETIHFSDAAAQKRPFLGFWILSFKATEVAEKGAISDIVFSNERKEFYIQVKKVNHALDVSELRDDKIAEMMKDVPKVDDTKNTWSANKIILKAFINPRIYWQKDDNHSRTFIFFALDDQLMYAKCTIHTLHLHQTLLYINRYRKRYILDLSMIGKADRKEIIERAHMDSEHKPDQDNFQFSGYPVQVILEPEPA